MSFLIGSLAGAVTTGGVYYGFSNLIQTRTAQHRDDLHTLSARLLGADTTIQGPAPASARIVERPFATMLQSRWNAHVANVFGTVGGWERKGSEWVHGMLYGETWPEWAAWSSPASPASPSSSPPSPPSASS